MDIGRAVAYIFEDKDWLSKLLPLMVIGVFSLIPIFGLIATALAIGYMLFLASNVRDGLPRPLPKWDDGQVRTKLNVGGQVLTAMIAYNLPTIFMGLCSYTLISGLASGFLGSSVTFVVFCCTAPILLLYTAVTWGMLAIGVAEFMETGEWQRMFRITHLWDALRSNNQTVFQWGLYTFLANLGIGVLGAIPCIGWVAIGLFAIPIQGHLFGQFAHRLSIKSKPHKKYKN